jgi:hypothetical protein
MCMRRAQCRLSSFSSSERESDLTYIRLATQGNRNRSRLSRGIVCWTVGLITKPLSSVPRVTLLKDDLFSYRCVITLGHVWLLRHFFSIQNGERKTCAWPQSFLWNLWLCPHSTMLWFGPMECAWECGLKIIRDYRLFRLFFASCIEMERYKAADTWRITGHSHRPECTGKKWE